MRIEQLEYFLDVAKTKSLNISAERLFVTQPTISEAMHKLEEELDAALLIRSKKGVSLTEAGEVVVKWAERILSDVKNMQEEIWELQSQINPELKGDLCIGGTNLVSNLIMPDVIDGFGKAYPNICVTNFSVRHYEIPEFLERDTMDMAVFNVCRSPYAELDPEKQMILKMDDCELIYEEPLFVIVGKNLPISKEKQVSLEQVVEYPLVLLQTYGQEDNGLAQILRKAGDAKFVLKTDNMKMIRQAILNERGIGLFAKSAFGRIFFNDVEDSELVRVIKLRKDVKLQYYLGIKKEKRLNMPEKAFIAYLKDYVKKIND
ncbi:MAG: LysR family transcriptional regulator [Peptococcaceae bacterium]|nr:LysR family transcriptional regulator [Peptococcaceae bacterium]